MQSITRTITTTIVNVRVLNPQTEQFDNSTITLPGKIKDKEKIERMVKKELNDTNLHYVKIISFSHNDAVYGMPIDTFIAHATRVTE